jgi:hypothetical protein
MLTTTSYLILALILFGPLLYQPPGEKQTP